MKCRACDGATETVFEMEPMPLAGAFALTRDEALAAHKYPLEWRWCRTCGLVNVAPDIPGELIFADYSYRASDVPALVRHHRDFATWLTRRYGTEPLRYLEIGGNDGVLLAQLPPEWERWNVDPSDVARVPMADWSIVSEPWPVDLGTFDLITSSNAFAHFSAIGSALAAIRAALRPGGQFVMEVHDLAATLDTAQWDTIYHEHAVEWSEDALYRAGAMHGLLLRLVMHLPLHGGLLRAVFEKAPPWTAGKPPQPDFAPLVDGYRNRRKPALPDGSVAYGAAARATVYLNQVQPNVVAVVDGSPRRYGRFVPGVGLPIIPPSEFGDPPACLITAWNHAPDIQAAHPDYDGWVTAW